MQEKELKIANRFIGANHPCFIIAEAGINHNSNMETAKKMIWKAKEAGADAIKFQSFSADEMCDKKLSETKDVEDVTGGSKSSYDLYKSLELSLKQHETLFKEANKADIICFTSVFDCARAEELNNMGMPCFKISSGDINYKELICKTASFKKPVIMSTGMSYIGEVEQALLWNYKQHNYDISILHCTAIYPPCEEELNLNAIPAMQNAFNTIIGYSDHTIGTHIPIASVCMGSKILEKHFTLDNNMPGPDQKLSLDFLGFKQMVDQIRAVEAGLGDCIKKPVLREIDLRKSGRRGMKAARNLTEGHILSRRDIRFIKPGIGIEPKDIDKIIGMKLKQDIKMDDTIEWKNV